MDKEVEQDLWQLYAETKSPQLRDALITQYHPLAKHCATKLWQRIRHTDTSLEWDDLLGAACLGLIYAVDNFEPQRGVTFTTRAYPRIVGAIIDWLRVVDNIPRSARLRGNKIAQFELQWELEYGRLPTNEEISSHLNLPVGKVEESKATLYRSHTVSSLDAMTEEDSGGLLELSGIIADTRLTAEEILTGHFAAASLSDALGRLNEVEYKVVKGLAMARRGSADISNLATRLGISESRLYQIRSKALLKLRTLLSPAA